MSLEEKYLNESINNSKDIKKIFNLADKLVAEVMNLSYKYTDKLMKETEKNYLKDPERMSPAAARDIFLSKFTKGMENYLNGIIRSIGK